MSIQSPMCCLIKDKTQLKQTCISNTTNISKLKKKTISDDIDVQDAIYNLYFKNSPVDTRQRWFYFFIY